MTFSLMIFAHSCSYGTYEGTHKTKEILSKSGFTYLVEAESLCLQRIGE